MQISLTIISFALLLTIAIIMAGGTTLQVVDHLSSDLDYPEFNIKSVEASTSETATGTNTTTSNATKSATASSLPQTTSIRSYLNPIFGIGVDYPSTWSAFELNSRLPGNTTYAIAQLRSPLENASDKYSERVSFGLQKMNNSMTLNDYTSQSLDTYRNRTGINILESNSTTLAGQPAHKIVYTDDTLKGIKLKKIQVWSVINNTNAYVITFGSEDSRFADYLPEVDNIIRSFRIVNDSSNAGNNNIKSLAFDDPKFGVKLQYPPTWTKFQPGRISPQTNLDVIVAFLHPETQNASFVSRIGFGVQQLAQNASLDQFTSSQMGAINRANATVLGSEDTTIAGNPGHSAVFTLNNATKVMQMWTLKGNKAYIMSYQASPNEYPTNLPTFQSIMDSLTIR